MVMQSREQYTSVSAVVYKTLEHKSVLIFGAVSLSVCLSVWHTLVSSTESSSFSLKPVSGLSQVCLI